jgi:hypothetical protein
VFHHCNSTQEMRYIRHNFSDNYLGFDGEDKQKILTDEFAKTLVMHPVEVAAVLKVNGIEVKSPDPKGLMKLIRDNSHNSKMMAQISAIVLSLNAGFDGANDSFLGIGKGKSADKKEPREKGALLNGIGNFINQNKDGIANTITGLQSIFGNNNSTNAVAQTVTHYEKIDVPKLGESTKGMQMPVWGWVAIGVGSVVVLGTLIFALRK